MTDYNAILGMEAGYYGWYAQLPEDGAEWDGQQLLSIKDDVKKSGAVFQPAIMPTKVRLRDLTSMECALAD